MYLFMNAVARRVLGLHTYVFVRKRVLLADSCTPETAVLHDFCGQTCSRYTFTQSIPQLVWLLCYRWVYGI